MTILLLANMVTAVSNKWVIFDMNALRSIDGVVRERAGDALLSIKAVVVTADKKALLLHRPDQMRWDLPGGGVEDNENLAEALKREMLEETGLAVNGKVTPIHGFMRDIPTKALKFIQYVLVELESASSELDVTLSDEHDNFKFWSIFSGEFPILIDSYKAAFEAAKKHLQDAE